MTDSYICKAVQFEVTEIPAYDELPTNLMS